MSGIDRIQSLREESRQESASRSKYRLGKYGLKMVTKRL